MQTFKTTPHKNSLPLMLNLGCGSTFHSDWLNVDFQGRGNEVLGYNLELGIPFADDSFDIVYHSHILEHFSKKWAEFFLQECFRVLKPGGLLRIAVPDLENIATAYLRTLEQAEDGDETANLRHNWMVIELIDQLTRRASGGEMIKWWKKQPCPQQDFIFERLGDEARKWIKNNAGKHEMPNSERLPALEPFQVEFLLSGEQHRWMYDRITLKNLLSQFGFTEIVKQKFNTSLRPDILKYKLDTGENGKIRKPDSLFMEAIKPKKEKKEQQLKVAMLCTYDFGGAGIAAIRQHQSLRQYGVISEFYTMQQCFSREAVHILPTYGFKPLNTGQKLENTIHETQQQSNTILQQTLKKYPNRPVGSTYYSLPIQKFDFSSVPLFDNFDILNLHWVATMCDPACSFNAFKGRPIVWTLHDMNPFTGGCHYADGCRGFEKYCGNCPQLGSHDENDLSRQTWKARMAAYRELDLHIVAPSQWLAEEAKKSSLFSRFPVHTIAYGQPLNVYQPYNRQELRRQMGIEPQKTVLLFAAQSLNNKRKGGMYLIQMLNILATQPNRERFLVLLLGDNPSKAFLETGITAETTGHINSDQAMAALYNVADAVLVPSLEDNQPNVICEALACGTPVVAFKSGGIPEMIQHEETGFLTAPKNVQGLVDGVLWAEKTKLSPITQKLCRARAMQNWSPEICAKKYLDLYKKISKNNKK